MANDQSGLPLLAIPQQNLFTTAADSLQNVLAQRDAARQKAMIDQATQSALAQKQADDSARTQAQTAMDTANVGKINQETETSKATAASAAAKTQQLGVAMDTLKSVLADPNSTPEARQAAAQDVRSRGGEILTDTQVKGLSADQAQAKIDDLTNKFIQSIPGSKDERKYGMLLLNAGGHLPAADHSGDFTLGPGQTRYANGKPVASVAPKPPASSLDDQELPNELKSYLNTLPTTVENGKPLSLADAVAKVQRGISGPGGRPGGQSLSEKYPRLDLAKVATYLRSIYGDPLAGAFKTGTAPAPEDVGAAAAEPVNPTPAAGATGAVPPPAASPTPTGGAQPPPLQIQNIPLPGGTSHAVRLGSDNLWHGEAGDVWQQANGKWTRIK